MPGEVYQALAEHQQSAGDWQLQPVAADLHLWAERFRLRFKLEVPIPALRLSALPVTRLGHYCPAYNPFGLRNEIAVSTRHIERCLGRGEMWRVLGTVLHEHLHLWQQVHGRPGRNNYHNVAFQRKAADLGLLVDRRGYTRYLPDSPFMALLREYGVGVPDLAEAPPAVRERGESKLKKWSCGCTNARVAVADFRAVCLTCGRAFSRAD